MTGRAQAPAVLFHSIGDLPGGPTLSTLRDATRVGSMIYAVGGSAQNNQTLCVSPGVPAGCVNTFGQDTPVLWSFDTVANTATLQALPAIVNNTTFGNSVIANAISTNGNYIASQARIASNNGQTAAVRVSRALLPVPSANLDLRPAPYNATAPSGTSAISADGSVLWGNNNLGRAQRYDTVNPAGNVTIPLLRPGDNRNNILAHDSSANGNVGAGISFNSATPSLTQAFRFSFNPATNTGSLLGLPFAPNGGTWNRAVDLSANGRFTLLAGDTAAYPNGQLMVHDASNGSITELGSPASAWRVSGFAGMTDDGAVVASSFFSAVGTSPGLGYIHNAHGWFQVNGMLRRAGIDLRGQGWDVEQSLNITGISGDGTLLFGAMPHNGTFEGFVLEFPAGYLANYDIQPVPAADTSIVGAWAKPGEPGAIIFMQDGTYYQIASNVPANQTGANGFERGFYTWDSATGRIAVDTLVDTNGDEGIGDSNDRAGITVTISGDTLTATVSPTDITTLVRLPTDLSSFIGAWVAGDPTAPDSSTVFVLMPDGTYLMAQDGDPLQNGLGGHDGMESGTVSIDLGTGLITATTAIDTNGDWGFSDPQGPVVIHLAADGLTASGTDDMGEPIFIRRIIDPNAVRPAFTNLGSVDISIGAPFTFAPSATFSPFSFTASGLPAGLSFDGATGVISGTPTVLGAFAVDLTASNSLATGTGVLVITVLDTTAPTIDASANIAVTSASASGTTVSYTAPASHDNVDGDGVATCTPASGANFAVGTTTVDCTATDAAGNTATSSFTVTVTYVPPPPTITRSGFYAPVKAGVNDQKGGSTVPLKFNVAVNGAQKTDTAGLEFSLTKVSCSTGAPIAPAAFTMTGGTALRYEDGQFIANWKTPSDAGACYVVKMTTTADGGSISATFKIK